MSTIPNEDRRTAYIEGLRTLADALEANDAIPLPYDGTASELSIFCRSRDELAALTRALPGPKDKQVTDSASYGFELHGRLHGLRWVAFADRDDVCTARVVGTETVTRKVPVVEFEEVTETRDVIEWECHPILAEQDAALGATA